MTTHYSDADRRFLAERQDRIDRLRMQRSVSEGPVSETIQALFAVIREEGATLSRLLDEVESSYLERGKVMESIRSIKGKKPTFSEESRALVASHGGYLPRISDGWKPEDVATRLRRMLLDPIDTRVAGSSALLFGALTTLDGAIEKLSDLFDRSHIDAAQAAIKEILSFGGESRVVKTKRLARLVEKLTKECEPGGRLGSLDFGVVREEAAREFARATTDSLERAVAPRAEMPLRSPIGVFREVLLAVGEVELALHLAPPTWDERQFLPSIDKPDPLMSPYLRELIETVRERIHSLTALPRREFVLALRDVASVTGAASKPVRHAIRVLQNEASLLREIPVAVDPDSVDQSVLEAVEGEHVPAETEPPSDSGGTAVDEEPSPSEVPDLAGVVITNEGINRLAEEFEIDPDMLVPTAVGDPTPEKGTHILSEGARYLVEELGVAPEVASSFSQLERSGVESLLALLSQFLDRPRAIEWITSDASILARPGDVSDAYYEISQAFVSACEGSSRDAIAAYEMAHAVLGHSPNMLRESPEVREEYCRLVAHVVSGILAKSSEGLIAEPEAFDPAKNPVRFASTAKRSGSEKLLLLIDVLGLDPLPEEAVVSADESRVREIKDMFAREGVDGDLAWAVLRAGFLANGQLRSGEHYLPMNFGMKKVANYPGGSNVFGREGKIVVDFLLECGAILNGAKKGEVWSLNSHEREITSDAARAAVRYVRSIFARGVRAGGS